MITVRTSPAYVNRVRQDWTANGGVYGDGGVYAVVPSNDPFAQLGPTLDLTFTGVPTNQLTAATADGYSINLNLSSEIYQIAAQYTVWTATGLTQVNFADIVTFTRASTATYFNSAGVLTTAAINEARFDYNPSTLAAQGLLIEEQRTNSIRNNTMQGAVAGTPGTDPTNWLNTIPVGITQQIVGVGTESGITYIDYRFFGTATASIVVRPDGETQVVASSGQAWTGSTYVRLIAGTLTNLSCSLNMRQGLAAGGLVLNTDVAFTPTTAALNTQRIVNAVASMQATTERILNRVILNATGAIDITLRIGLPQLEQGAFATSVIPTTTTALTRSADVASVNTLSPWYNALAGTLFAESVSSVPSATLSGAIQPNIVFITDGTSNNRIGMFYNTGNVISGRIVTAGATANPADISANLPSVNRSALAYAVGTNQGAVSVNASAVTTSSPAGLPVVDRMTLGAGTIGIQLNGYLRRIVYYPRRLPNADLQTITA